MQQLTDKQTIINQIEKLYVGGGGIYIQPSMQNGERIMNKETAQVRHFLLMSDGDDAETQEGSIEIALRMRMNKITTSVVAIGKGKDEKFLQSLAAAGGGRYYLADKASKLPAITTQDTSLMSRSAIEEGAFIPKMVAGDEILKGISDSGVPPLLAYCLSDSRPLTHISMRTGKDDPLLATWQYGLGTSMAFTSDAQPRWAIRWASWPGFGAFWSQAARAISRRATLNDYQVSVHQEAGQGKILVKALDKLGNPMTTSDALIRVAMPDGSFHEVTLDQQAPGVYSGNFDAGTIGTYIVTVAESDHAGGKRTAATGFSVPYPPEYSTYRANTPLLSRTSTTTNGLSITNPTQALRQVANPGVSITELWPLFLLFAALLLPVDIGVRRLALPMAEILQKVLARLHRARAPIPVAQQVVVGRLHQAKQRAQMDAPTEAPARVIIAADERPTEPQSKGGSPTSPGSAANRLLEAKRKRDK